MARTATASSSLSVRIVVNKRYSSWVSGTARHAKKKFCQLIRSVRVCVVSGASDLWGKPSYVSKCGLKKAQSCKLEKTVVEAQLDYVLKLNEIWSFVHHKKQKRWLWTAMCRHTRQIAAFAATIVLRPVPNCCVSSLRAINAVAALVTSRTFTQKSFLQRHTAASVKVQVKPATWNTGAIHLDSVLPAMSARPSLALNPTTCITSLPDDLSPNKAFCTR